MWIPEAGRRRRRKRYPRMTLHVEPEGIFAYTKRIDYGTGAEAAGAGGAAGRQERPDQAVQPHFRRLYRLCDDRSVI